MPQRPAAVIRALLLLVLLGTLLGGGPATATQVSVASTAGCATTVAGTSSTHGELTAPHATSSRLAAAPHAAAQGSPTLPVADRPGTTPLAVPLVLGQLPRPPTQSCASVLPPARSGRSPPLSAGT